MSRSTFFFLLIISVFSSQLFAEKTQRSKQENAVYYSMIRSSLQTPKFEYVLKYEDKAWDDLEISELVKVLDRTNLAAGAIEFADLIQPISNIQKLETRREIIKSLVENEKLFISIDPLLERFSKDYEDVILDLAFDQDRPKDLALTPLLIDIGFITFISSVILPYSVQSFRRNLQAGDQFLIVAINTVLGVLGSGLGLYEMGTKAYSRFTEYSSSMMKAYTFVSKFSEALSLIEKITDEMECSPLLSKSFPVFKKFRELSKTDEDLVDALDKIKNLSYYNSIEAYRAINSVGKEFGELLRGLGRLDAFFSVARLYQESLEAGKSFTFSEYTLDNDRPHFEFENLYIPFFEDPVPNSFSVNTHMILTGPHKAGKTASMKAIAYAHVLGQSITLVPASFARLTPVSSIKTYFQPKQSAAKGSSGNSVESLELRKLNQEAERLHQQEGKLGLFLIDEPYVNTRAIIGERRVLKFMEELISLRGSTVLLSTHLEEPASLEAKYPDLVRNYQPLVMGEGPEFQTTYKIVRGIADWWFKNQTRIDLYIDWLDEQLE